MSLGISIDLALLAEEVYASFPRAHLTGIRAFTEVSRGTIFLIGAIPRACIN